MYGEMEQWRMVRAIELDLAQVRYEPHGRRVAPHSSDRVDTPTAVRVPERTRVLTGWLALLLR